MCYQFNHNEQEAMWQSDIIYTLELTQWGGGDWKIAGYLWKLMEILKDRKQWKQ